MSPMMVTDLEDQITNVAKVRHYSRFRAVDPAVRDYFRPLAEAADVHRALEARETTGATVMNP